MQIISACPVTSIVRSLFKLYQCQLIRTFYGACLLSFLLLIFSLINPLTSSAHKEYSFPEATDGQINEALTRLVPIRFLPDQPLYSLITLKEIVNRAFQPSSAKRAQFDLVLSGKRIKETYLLMGQGDIKSASKNLKRYQSRLLLLNEQFNKARSQNQDVVVLVDLVAENLRDHETLFGAIAKKWKLEEDGFSFDDNFEAAISQFSNTVVLIDEVKPGLKDRFKTIIGNQQSGDNIIVAPSPDDSNFKIASPSGKPKRVIF